MIFVTRAPSGNNGTFGVLSMGGVPICVTCEEGAPPVPVGTYSCIPHSGPEFQNVWEITNVPNHTAILIHNGNTIKDTRGCMLVGESFAVVENLPAVINSRKTLDMLRKLLPAQFTITIR